MGIIKPRVISKNEGMTKHVNGMSYHVKLHSRDLPFAVSGSSLEGIDRANKILEKFIKELEKRFDVVWYMGTDYLGDELYERFMFHHGGFMEISLKGEINCYLIENKVDKLKDAISCAICKCGNMLDSRKLSSRLGAQRKKENMIKQIKVEQKLISIKGSLLREEGGKK